MKGIFIPKTLVDETLSQSVEDGKRVLEPFESFAKEKGIKVSILEDTNVTARAEVHRKGIDFFYCLEGEVEFVTGGKLVNAFVREYEDGTKNEFEIRAPSIEGGEVQTLVKGDMIWIPAGVPHLHRAEGTARLMVVKIAADVAYPLEETPGLIL